MSRLDRVVSTRDRPPGPAADGLSPWG